MRRLMAMNRKHTPRKQTTPRKHTERPVRRSIGALTLAAGAVIGWAPLTSDALAQGNALQRNVGGPPAATGSKISNPALRSSIGAQNRLNNAIVTGNVGGGKQFRGSVGYSGDLDFRGSTGSDDLFRFQRDSFGSGLAAQGVRGIGGLQDAMGLSTNALPSSIAGATILQRESAGVNATALGGSGSRLSGGGGGGGINPSTFRSGGLRSLSKNTSDAVAEPVTFAPRAGQAGTQTTGVGASALRGLYALTPPTLPAAGAAPASSTSSLRTSPATAPPTRPGAVESQRVSAAAAPAPETGRIEVDSSYTRLLAQLEAGRMGNARAGAPVTPPEGVPENKPGWVRPPETPRGPNDPNEPNAKPEGAPSPAANPLSTPPGVDQRGAGPQPQAVEDADLPFAERLDRLRDRLMRGGKASDEGDASAAKRNAVTSAEDDQDEDEMDADAKDDHEAVRRDAKDLFGAERPKVQRFIDPTTDPTALDRHMLAGQAALAKDKWFDAEESFTKAILARPTDPMPAIGRVHAQIGAGMFLSAAINARALFRAHPELAAAQYDETLLPRAERLEKVYESLRDAASRDNAFGRDCGLLLAYLGWQTGSPADMEAGLAAVERIEKHLDIPPDPLVAALRALWTPATP